MRIVYETMEARFHKLSEDDLSSLFVGKNADKLTKQNWEYYEVNNRTIIEFGYCEISWFVGRVPPKNILLDLIQ